MTCGSVLLMTRRSAPDLTVSGATNLILWPLNRMYTVLLTALLAGFAELVASPVPKTAAARAATAMTVRALPLEMR